MAIVAEYERHVKPGDRILVFDLLKMFSNSKTVSSFTITLKVCYKTSQLVSVECCTRLLPPSQITIVLAFSLHLKLRLF
jgi:hypothetical protein